jgi:hypothetical protein
MKIFYKVQVSNTTMVDGEYKWLLRNDACVNICVGIVSALLDRDNSLKFVIGLPPLEDVLDLKTHEELFDKKYLDNIEFLWIQQPIHPMHSRFHFSFYEFNNQYEHNLPLKGLRNDCLSDVDVMINDDNTLTKNWKAFFHYCGLNIPMVSTNYFFDEPAMSKVPKQFSYFQRQIETLDNSDLVAFQCSASKTRILDAYCAYRNFSIPQKYDFCQDKKFSVWGVGCHAAEITKFKTNTRFDRKTIYFGNRITESAGRYTNWHVYAKAIGELSKERRDFDAWVLNPTHKISQNQIDEIMSLSNGYMKIIRNDDEFTREDYLKFINQAHICAGLFVNEVHGGVTSREGGLAGNYLVIPQVNQYALLFENDYPFYVNPELNNLKEILNKALNWDDEIWRKKISKRIFETDSYENASTVILDDLKKLYGER